MRYIVKRNNYGHFLDRAHATPPQTPQQATSRWSSFGHKPQILDFLLAEQYHLCCYSELRADELNVGYHIEHVENKSANPQRTFDFTNFAASAFSGGDIPSFLTTYSSPAGPRTIFGGHAPGKQKSVDINRFISPHQPDCSRFFIYISDGRITPTQGLNNVDTDRAQYTIDLLNLNSPFLVTQRRKWWSELDDLFEEHSDDAFDISCLVGIHLIPHGEYIYPFFSLTRGFFGRISEEILQNDAPNLL